MLNQQQIRTLQDIEPLWITIRDHQYMPDGSAAKVQSVINIWVELGRGIPNTSCPACIVNYFKEVYQIYYTQIKNN